MAFAWTAHVQKNKVPTWARVLRTVSGSDVFNANSEHSQIVADLWGPMNSAMMYWKKERGNSVGDRSKISGIASFNTVPAIRY